MSTGRGWWAAYAGFLLNGMAVVLLGPLLPRLQSLWRLNDGHGGALLAAQFLGMSLGTIFVRRRGHHAMTLGAMSASAGLAALGLLVLAGGLLAHVELLACACLATYGFGLGQTITALNLSAGSESQGRSARLSFGNAMWSAGAICGPLVVALALRGSSLGWWLIGVAAAFPLVWLVRFGDKDVPNHEREIQPETGSGVALAIVVVSGLLMFLYGSAEACFSGWVTTFAGRAGGAGTVVSPLTTSAFWFGVAGGRALAGIVLRGWQERPALLMVLCGAAAASVGLMFANGMGQITIWAALAGLTIGPAFPLILAELLNRRASPREAGMVLAMCGVGATVMPLLFGVVSERTSSLREALVLPGICLLAMLVLVWRGRPSCERV